MTDIDDTLKSLRAEVKDAADAGFPFALESLDRSQAIEEWKFLSGKEIPEGSLVSIPMPDGREQQVHLYRKYYRTRWEEVKGRWVYLFGIECRECDEPEEAPELPEAEAHLWDAGGAWFDYEAKPDFKALPVFCPKHSNGALPVEPQARRKARSSPNRDAVGETVEGLRHLGRISVADFMAEAVPKLDRPKGRDTRRQRIMEILERFEGVTVSEGIVIFDG